MRRKSYSKSKKIRRRSAKKLVRKSAKKSAKKLVRKSVRKSARTSRTKKPNKKRRSRTKTIVGAVLGTTAVLGAAALAAYKLKKKFKHEPVVYEEDKYLLENKKYLEELNKLPLLKQPIPLELEEEIFMDASPKNFDIRTANWTEKTKKTEKVKATNTMYKTQDVKILKSKNMITDIINKHPQLLPVVNQKASSIPNMIVINIQLPRKDKEFYSIFIVFELKPETIKKPEFNNAVKLLEKYTKEYNNEKFLGEKGRLKGRGAITDTKNIDFPYGFGWIKGYIPEVNYKGVLLKKTLKIFEKAGIFEIDIDVNKFVIPFVPNSIIPMMYDRIKKGEFELGFQLEGITPDELPEALIGAVNINGLDLKNGQEV
jgi:hypothetical protein